jgi:hypothetical protein
MTIKVFDSAGCDISFSGTPITSIVISTEDKPRILNLKEMVTTPLC